jgi:hypothetical protein
MSSTPPVQTDTFRAPDATETLRKPQANTMVNERTSTPMPCNVPAMAPVLAPGSGTGCRKLGSSTGQVKHRVQARTLKRYCVASLRLSVTTLSLRNGASADDGLAQPFGCSKAAENCKPRRGRRYREWAMRTQRWGTFAQFVWC